MQSRAFLHAFLGICLVVLVAEGGKHDTVEAEEEKALSVRDLQVEIDYEPVGCFKDKARDRALDMLVKSFRGKKKLGDKNIWYYWNRNETRHIIQRCAEEAFEKGYSIVGIQYFGECWSGKDAEENYDRHGMSKNCGKGVGKKNTNYVYRIKVKPVQIKAPSSVCNVEGQTYDDGDSMEVYKGDLASGECEQCTCKEGKLDCHHIFECVLDDSSCNSYIKKPDQCCPECQRDVPVDAPTCQVKDKTYKQGQSMEILQDHGDKQLSECHQCTCMDGKLDKCHRIYYCELNKPGCTNFIKSAGQCCPTCARVLPKPPPPSCKVGGRNYKDGASMEVLHMSYDQKNGSCHQCRCKEGQVDGCHHIFHCTLDDPSCARYEKHSHEQCCPVCVKIEPNPQAPSCKINGLLYKDGESSEVLQESADKTSIFCQQCKCEAGKHSCHKIFDCDIQKVACERSLKIPGQCCPECACFHNGEHLAPGDQWQKVSGDECITCTCRKDGTANCTRMPGSCQSE